MATDGGRRLLAVWTRLASAFFEWNHSMTAAPGSSPIQALLDSLHARYADFRDGEVAAYIPELAKADPDSFGICLATADGFVYESGDSRHEFTLQSISKPFVYGLALDDHGVSQMFTKVGVEPSGDAFNAISLHKTTGRPLNPMINAGAIATTGQIRADTPGQRLQRILEMFGRYTGRPMRIDREVYESESRTGHRNRAIGHLLRNFDVLDGDPTDAVDVYFQQCSISVRCIDLALMGATLANQGMNPVTGERAIEDEHVENVLSVMASCGMYDFSGGWIYNVGMPAKSGVAGGVLAVLPGQLGIGVFSPRLDEQGNSARALKVCEELSRIWQLHQFNPPSSPQSSRRLSCTAAERSSTRSRHAVERTCLRNHGARIRMVEIQGNLAFSTTEPIVRWILGQADQPQTVILDFLHATAINGAAARLLAALADDLARRGTVTLFTHAQWLPALREEVVACGAAAAAVECMFRFPSTDQALEWCEDQLLAEMMPARAEGIGDLRSFEIAAGLTDEELAVLGGLLARRTYATGELIIRSGDDATNLFLITKGLVGVWLGEPGKGTRVASFSVGTMVGELAFIDGERRSANVAAEMDLECGVLEVEDFLGLQESHPRIHATILRNIGVSLATKLRRATEHLSVLSTQAR
jgi:glutaminase